MEYVYTVYKEKSFTKAAEKLYISQPSLSAAIKKLEEEIGSPLFERRYTSVKPTKTGLLYIETAEKIMDLEKEFSEKISDMNKLEFGHIAVGGSNYVSSYILPKIVSRFSELYPKITVSLKESNSVELEKKINDEEIDLIIDSFGEKKDTYEMLPLMTEKIMPAVPSDFKCNIKLEKFRILPEEIYSNNYSEKETVSIKKFKDEKFILLKKGNDMYQHAMRIFQKANITPTVSFYLDQLSTSCTLAASNQGICFVTDTLFRYQNYADDFYLYNIKTSGTRTLYLAQKKNRYTTKAMSRFMDISKDLL